jgi:hypothetical protein
MELEILEEIITHSSRYLKYDESHMLSWEKFLILAGCWFIMNQKQKMAALRVIKFQFYVKVKMDRKILL